MVNFKINGQATVPVPTLFIDRHMCDAPPEYVKVYLYGLYLAYGGENAQETDMEEKLHMSSSQINDAFAYWQRRGLMTGGEGADNRTFEFLMQEQVEAKKSKADILPLYEYRDFNKKLTGILGRSLSPTEYEKIYDYTDIFKLPREVVLLMIEHCVKTRGQKVSLAYIDKVAKTWAEEGTDTLEKARAKLEAHSINTSGIRAVMTNMGLNKAPDKTQTDLYFKWRDEWGFSQESILYAMEGMEFSGNSPFKYLDAKLSALYEKGITTSSQISEFDSDGNKKRSCIKEILRTLGLKSSYIRPNHERYYDSWVSSGISQEIILMACSHCAQSEAGTVKSVDALLREWQNLGLYTQSEIKAHMLKQGSLDLLVKQVFEAAGLKKDVGENERNFYLNYTQNSGMSHEALLYCASCSSLADHPLSYMNAVLNSWAKEGVKTLDQAKTQDMSRFSRGRGKAKSFEEHSYTPQDMEQHMKEDDEIIEGLLNEKKRHS